jgi:hypothetical protein
MMKTDFFSVETLEWFLKGLANTNNPDYCPCSRYYCEHGSGPRFYKLAIALVPSLRLPQEYTAILFSSFKVAEYTWFFSKDLYKKCIDRKVQHV